MYKLSTIPLQTKIILLLLGALVLFGGAYTVYQGAPLEKQSDTYVTTIHSNADAITNQVNGVVKAQGTEDSLKYWGDCDNALLTIRMQNTEAESGYTTLSENHKPINVKYRAFLHEAANVIITCENEDKPDLTKMNAAKAALN
jgi:hypothetical protein